MSKVMRMRNRVSQLINIVRASKTLSVHRDPTNIDNLIRI